MGSTRRAAGLVRGRARVYTSPEREATTCGPRFMAAGGRTEPLANPNRARYEVPAMPRRFLVSTLAAALLLVSSAHGRAGGKAESWVSRRSPPDTFSWTSMGGGTTPFSGSGRSPAFPSTKTTASHSRPHSTSSAPRSGSSTAPGWKPIVRGTQWDAFNKNETEFVCMKSRPVTPGNPWLEVQWCGRPVRQALINRRSPIHWSSQTRGCTERKSSIGMPPAPTVSARAPRCVWVNATVPGVPRG